ncbi:unnamed protein product [Knipowitschia caucasica]
MAIYKKCIGCHREIGVAAKICGICGCKQPYKTKLEAAKKKIDGNWKDTQQKNKSVNKLYDTTNLLLHKWSVLERYPLLLLGKRIGQTFVAECLCPVEPSCPQEAEALATIKKIFESLLNVRMLSEAGTTPADTSDRPSTSLLSLTSNSVGSTLLPPPPVTFALPRLSSSTTSAPHSSDFTTLTPVSPSTTSAPHSSDFTTLTPVSPSTTSAPHSSDFITLTPVSPSTTSAPHSSDFTTLTPVSPSTTSAPHSSDFTTLTPVSPSTTSATHSSDFITLTPVSPSTTSAPHSSDFTTLTPVSTSTTSAPHSSVFTTLTPVSTSTTSAPHSSVLTTLTPFSSSPASAPHSSVSTTLTPLCTTTISSAPHSSELTTVTPLFPSSFSSPTLASDLSAVIVQPSSTSTTAAPKAATKRAKKPKECHHNLEFYPVKKIIRDRVREGREEVCVQWQPCTTCGAKWKNTWEPKANFVQSHNI